MRYVSVDIETSGLDYEKNKILSFGAIIEDTTKKLPFDELPKFNAVVIQREIVGSPRALTMNSHLIDYIGQYLDADENLKKEIEKISGYKFYEEEKIVDEFYDFLGTQGYSTLVLNKPYTLNVAGKNFATFDKLFLEQLPKWKKLIRVRQRIIDPSVMFCDWSNDDALPSLTDCKKRANLDEVVSHNALEDAWDVIQLLRKFY